MRDKELKDADKGGNPISADVYIQDVILKEEKGSSELIERKNRTKRAIKSYFPEIKYFTLSRPHPNNGVSLSQMSELQLHELHQEFED